MWHSQLNTQTCGQGCRVARLNTESVNARPNAWLKGSTRGGGQLQLLQSCATKPKCSADFCTCQQDLRHLRTLYGYFLPTDHWKFLLNLCHKWAFGPIKTSAQCMFNLAHNFIFSPASSLCVSVDILIYTYCKSKFTLKYFFSCSTEKSKLFPEHYNSRSRKQIQVFVFPAEKQHSAAL